MKTHQTITFFLASLRGGGAERVMLQLANSFAERGLKVDLLLAQNEGVYFSDISPHIRLINLSASRVLFSFPKLIKYLQQEQPISILCALNHVNLLALWAKVFSNRSTQVIVTVHNTLSQARQGSDLQKRSLIHWSIHQFYPWANEIVAVSRGVADDLAVTARLPRETIKVIYNPVVTPKLFDLAQIKIEHPWFSAREPPVILGVGRLTQQKDFQTLIKAFAILQQTYSARLMILGEGEERPQLEALIQELKLENQVSLLGFVNNPFAYMSKAALFVLSSAWEGLPTVLIEAMAVGIPVVSTHCPSGPEEILQQGKYGQLVPVGDVEKLAQAMLITLQNPQSSEILQQRAMDFSIDNSVQQYLALIHSM